MQKLDLAVGIADAAIEAKAQCEPLDIDAVADSLLETHPGAGASREEVVEALEDQVIPVALV